MEWKKRVISYYVSSAEEIKAIPEELDMRIYNEFKAIDAICIPTGAITLALDIDCTFGQAVSAVALALTNIGIDLQATMRAEAYDAIAHIVKGAEFNASVDVDISAIKAISNAANPQDVGMLIAYVSSAGKAYVLKATPGDTSATVDMSSELGIIESVTIDNVEDFDSLEIGLSLDTLEKILTIGIGNTRADAGSIDAEASAIMQDLVSADLDHVALIINTSVTIGMLTKAFISDYSSTYVSELGYINDTLFI